MTSKPPATRSSANVLVLPAEIWAAVGSKISSLSTLNELSLTCRAFNAIFSPLLFETRLIQLNVWDPARLNNAERKCFPPGMEQTKQLGILLNEWHGTKLDYNKANNQRYSKFITATAASMPKLESFWWDDQAFEDYDPAQILHYKRLVDVLSTSPNLKNLSISFSQQFLDSPEDARKSFIYLGNFKNLTSLELYHFYGKQKRLIRDISRVLSRCRALDTLGLALACDADCFNGPEAIILDSESDFMERLCTEFGSLGCEPLKLHTLKLGYGMVVADPVEVTENYLELLFRPELLHTFHIFNGLIKYDSEEEDAVDLDIAWDLLKDCTFLHELAVSRLDKEAGAWLNKTAQNLKELIITERHSTDDRTRRVLPTLKHYLTSLRAQNITFSNTSEDAWSDTDSSVADSHESDDSHVVITVDNGEVEMSGNGLVENKLDDKIITVLDLFNDHGSHLTHLSMTYDFSGQEDHFFSHLKGLKVLTHLYLQPRKRRYRGQALHLHQVETETARDHGARQAKHLKLACPSLQFVQIDTWAWQIIAQRDLSKIDKGNVSSYFELVDMDWNEVYNIDIFAMDAINTQAGLPKKMLVPPMGFHEDD